MNENELKPPKLGELRKPVRLGRDHGTSMDAMIRRILPDAVEDDGMSPIDVCAFNSSI